MSNKSTDKRYNWHKHYKSYLDSGLSQKEYCRQKNVSYWAFNPWKRKFEKENNKFYKISPEVIKSISVKKEMIEISYRDKFLIKIPEGFSRDTLKDIINILGEIQ